MTEDLGKHGMPGYEASRTPETLGKMAAARDEADRWLEELDEALAEAEALASHHWGARRGNLRG